MKFLLLIFLLGASSVGSAEANNCPKLGLNEQQALSEYDFSIEFCLRMGSDSLGGVNSLRSAELHIYLCKKNNEYYKVALAHNALDLINIMNTSMGFNCPTGEGKAIFWVDPVAF